jgi:hypothetical protein
MRDDGLLGWTVAAQFAALVAIKLPAADRARVLALRGAWQASGRLAGPDATWVRALLARNARAVRALVDARERARASAARAALGLTQADVAARVQARAQGQAAADADLGF